MRVSEPATGYGTCGFHQHSVQNTAQAPESAHRVILLCQVHLLSEVSRVVTFLGMGGGVATMGCKGCSSCFLYGTLHLGKTFTLKQGRVDDMV